MTVVSLDIVARDQASAVLSRIGGTAKKVGGVLGVALGGQILVGGLTKTINLAKDYDLTMRQIGVQTGETGKGMASLSKLALKMGADTSFSSKDAADAMLELAKGGLTSAQIKAGALNTTMTLAAAGGLNLGDAAGYVTQAMNTFGLSAGKSKDVAVALAGGANASTASVESLGMALSQVGPGAKNAGVSLQDTVAVLSAFDNAGIKGSDAGTSFKTMLQRLVPTTNQAKTAMAEYGLSFSNADGSFKSMTQVAQDLRTHLSGLTETQRAQALQAIFGSDATRAATVLMNNGAKGLQTYIDATKNQATVQKMAKTSMEGASGAWNQFTGSLETAAIQLGTKMLPGFTSAANEGAKFINEAMTWGPGISETLGPVVEVGTSLAKTLGPLAQLAGDVGEGFAHLPGPIRSVVVEGALLALLLPRLSAGAAAAGTSFMVAGTKTVGFGQAMMNASTRGAAASSMMMKLGGAARMAAGVGGMLALQKGMTSTSRATEVAMSAMGGAALGFSVAGPVGLAVGGLGGALLGLAKKPKAVSDAFKISEGDLDGYAGTLDQISGAATDASKKMALLELQKNGTLKAGTAAGMNPTTLVNATLGKPEAIAKVTAAMKAAATQAKTLQTQADSAKAKAQAQVAAAQVGPGSNMAASSGLKNIPDYGKIQKQADAAAQASKALGSIVGSTAESFAKQSIKVRQAALVAGHYGGALKGLPHDVATKIRANGVEGGISAVKKLATEYRRTPKQVQTLMVAAGVPVSLKQARSLVKGWKSAGTDSSKGVNDGLREAGNVKPNTAKWVGGVKGAVAQGTAAAAGATAVGAALKSGVILGFAGTGAALSAQAAAAVRSAIAAARAAADAHSPSRKMHQLGEDMGEGARRGLHAKQIPVGAEGAALITSLVAGISKKKVKVKDALDAVSSEVQTRLDKLNDLISQKADFAAGFQNFGSSIFSGEDDDKPVTVASILKSQQTKAAAAASLNDDVQSLLSKGISTDYLQQIQSSGASGVKTIHALAGADAGTIGQLNNLNASTVGSYAAAGSSAGQQVFGRQIQEAFDYEKQAEAIATALAGAGIGMLQLDGQVLQTSIDKNAKKKGKKKR